MSETCEVCGRERDSEHGESSIATVWGPIPIQLCPNMPRDRVIMSNPDNNDTVMIDCDDD